MANKKENFDPLSLLLNEDYELPQEDVLYNQKQAEKKAKEEKEKKVLENKIIELEKELKCLLKKIKNVKTNSNKVYYNDKGYRIDYINYRHIENAIFTVRREIKQAKKN